MQNGDPDLSGIWRRTVAAHESIEAHPKTLDDQETPSSVVDPIDGYTPLQPWAEAQRRYNRTAYVHHNAICRLDGVPLSMYMTGLYQFNQTPRNILIQGEEAHAFRMIPFSVSHKLSEEIKLWNGDSIGSWDNNTFVVDTTNQNARAWLDQRGRFFTDEAHVEERFTLVDDNTLHYQATITDDNVFFSQQELMNLLMNVEAFDGEFPEKSIQTFLDFVDLTIDEFWECVDRFRQDHIRKKENGKWKIRSQVS